MNDEDIHYPKMFIKVLVISLTCVGLSLISSSFFVCHRDSFKYPVRHLPVSNIHTRNLRTHYTSFRLSPNVYISTTLVCLQSVFAVIVCLRLPYGFTASTSTESAEVLPLSRFLFNYCFQILRPLSISPLTFFRLPRSSSNNSICLFRFSNSCSTSSPLVGSVVKPHFLALSEAPPGGIGCPDG